MATQSASATFDGGFADPVFDLQAVFRRMMEAFSAPGSIVETGLLASARAPLPPAAAAILAALADYDTPVWFEQPHDRAAAWLTFQTGARIADGPEGAAFAILAAGSNVAGWGRLPIGTAEYPDRSATLLLPVTSFRGGRPLVLRGPGIETSEEISVDGLPGGFLETMAANAAGYPLGFDLLLVCDSALVALPRTTKIAEA